MKALRKFESGFAKFRVEEIDAPRPGDDEILVNVEYAGICGTDLHIYHDTYDDAPPMTIGHEFSGVVTEVGKNITKFKIGDRIVSETNAEYCGECYLCKQGRFCLCDARKAIGQKTDGVFAQEAVLRASNVHLLPVNVSMKAAALAEPLSCVVHAVMERSKIQAGDNVLVSGPGPIGLMAVMIAKLSGANVMLTGTSIDADRLELGKEIGADQTVDVMSENIQEAVDKFTSNTGVDVVLECSGSGAAVSTGIKALRKLGIFTQIGLFGANASVDLNAMCYKEISYFGCLSKTNWSWRRTTEILGSEKLPLEKLVSHVFRLDQWQEAFAVADQKSGTKILFKP